MGRSNVRATAFGLALGAAAIAATSAGLAAQQAGSIRGQVTDAVTSRPLSSAQVSVVGTGRGGLANASGQYLVLNVPAGTQTVRVELIGYAPMEQEVTVTGGEVATSDFQLVQQALALDAIVVTGTAGETQRRSIGNSVTSFDAASVTESVPVLSLQEMLQGRSPGLTLISNGGGAGDGSRITLRGAGSLEGRFEPVVYIDGVRIESEGAQDGMCGSVTHCTSALDFLNPNDVESVEIIKGPAASTLYGAEAAGGVIQIMTKRGRPGTGIQWSAGVDMGTSDWNLATPITYWQCTASDVDPSSTFPGCHGETAGTVRTYQPMDQNPNAMRGNTGSDDPNGAGTYALNLSARGGGEAFSYFISAENSDEQGIFLNNYSRRTGGRANFAFTPTDQVDFTVNFGYARTHVRAPLSNNSSNSILRNAYRGRADAAYQYEVGYRNFGPTLANEWDLQTEGERYTIGATLNYQPASWFQNRLVMGLDYQNREVTDFTGIDQTGNQPWGTTRSLGFIGIELRPLHNWTVDYAGTVSTDIGDDYTSAFSAGVQMLARKAEDFTVEGEGLVANNLNLISSAAINRAGQGFSEQTSLGFYFQEQVGWRNRLFATAAVRIDDNSAFGEDFSLVVYPKAQLSYVISDEDFFDYEMIDQLKLRAAWGQAGNPPDPFVADRTFEAGATSVGDQIVNLLRPSSFGNPDLKAETGSELELGFESSLFDGRMGVDFTYYNQKTRDALIAVPDPPSSGYSGEHLVNVGEVSSVGLEVLLTGTPLYTRRVQWDASVAFSTNKGELVSWGEAPLTEIEYGSFATVQRDIPGYPIGGFWSTDVERDANGAPILDGSGDVTVEEDKEYVGPSTPTREIGFTNTFTLFDNFRVFANLDYKAGHYQWCAICSIRSRIDLNTRLINDPNSDPVDVAVAQSLQTKTWIKPADFLKLREISLSYRLPASLLENVRMDDATLTVSARNLWMWTKYDLDEGLGSPDPEVNFNSQSRFGRADYASIPMLRTFSVGLRVNF
jgi:TonB-linked SusC/RagA family outer membrane protein